MNADHCVALIMAAGLSRRYGSDKRCAVLADGQTLLATTLSRAHAAFGHVRVILREDDDLDRLGLPPATEAYHVSAECSQSGLGLSIASAFSMLLRDPRMAELESAAIWLGDLPWIRTITCHALLNQANAERIVRPRHGQRMGHPVLFGRVFWHELAETQDSHGASAIIRRHISHLVTIDVDDPGIHTDIDRPSDLLSTRR